MVARLALVLAASCGLVVSGQQAAPTQQEQPYRPGPGIENPQPIRSAQPKYTAEASRNRIQGVVEVEVVVLPTGAVGEVRVVKSLDTAFGLDNEAIAAAKQWLFRPGRLARDGRAVPVIVTIILEFRLGGPGTLATAFAPAEIVAGDDFYQDAYPLLYPALVQPAIVRPVQPKYTPEAMRAKLQGTVEVEAVVGTDGRVIRARIHKSLDARLGLDDNALAAAKSWIFEPATLNGQPVPVVVRLMLEFRIR
jgi:TonB family protein